MRTLLAIPLLLLLSAALGAQEGGRPKPVRPVPKGKPKVTKPKEKPAEKKPDAKPGEGMTAIVNGDVLTVTRGTYGRGTVLIGKDGKIEAAGVRVKVPEGAKVIDAIGKIVTPGLVAPLSSGIGVSGRVSGSNRYADALDPNQLNVELALAAGITTVFARPRRGGGMTSAVFKMVRGELEGMLVKEPAAVSITYSLASQRFTVRDSFKKARKYLADLEAYEKKKAAGEKVKAPRRPVGEEYVALLKRELPARIGVSGADDILASLALVDDFGIRLVLEGAAESWIVADEIARRGVAVLLTPRNIPRRDRMKDGPNGGTIECARILEEKGVRFGIIPVGGMMGPGYRISLGGIAGRDLLFYTMEAAFAIRGGASERAVLRAITIVAADVLGVADRVGSIEQGKDADLVIWGGDPFALTSWAETVFVNGKVVYEREKSGIVVPPK